MGSVGQMAPARGKPLWRDGVFVILRPPRYLASALRALRDVQVAGGLHALAFESAAAGQQVCVCVCVITIRLIGCVALYRLHLWGLTESARRARTCNLFLDLSTLARPVLRF